MKWGLAATRILSCVAISGSILVLHACAQPSGVRKADAPRVYKAYEGPDLADEEVAILDWLDRNAPVVVEIDGRRVTAAGTSGQSGPPPKRAKLQPGTHRIVLRDVAAIRRNGTALYEPAPRFPMSLNTRAGHTYVMKQDWHDAGWGYEINNIWIEDETTGEVVAGQSSPSEEYAQSRFAVHIAQWKSLCRRAVEGDGSAQSNIGSHYRHGWEPVKQNFVLAFKWFSLGAKAGYDDAARYRDEVAAQMTPEQVAEARQLIGEWTPDAEDCEVERLISSPG